MVEAAKGSPVHASSAMSESEFVAQTFQALIDQLQSKERELAALHDSNGTAPNAPKDSASACSQTFQRINHG